MSNLDKLTKTQGEKTSNLCELTHLEDIIQTCGVPDINEIQQAAQNGEYMDFHGTAQCLQQQTNQILECINHCHTRNNRERLENQLHLLSQVKAEFINNLINYKVLDKSDINLFFPTINNENFNSGISQIARFSQYSIPEIKGKEDFLTERSPNFSRTAPQNFVASYISPDTPYNGVLLWHGVGAGKTCAALGIAETFLNVENESHKKILILTPSEQLHSEWRKEIFNLSKEISKDKYNIYLANGGQEKYFEWLLKGSKTQVTDTQEGETASQNPHERIVPINNIQCTGNKYNPFKSKVSEQIRGDIEKNKKRYERLIKQNINEQYDFETYNILVNKYEKQSRKLFFNKTREVEGKLVRYIRNKFSHRVIIMDEIHRVREKSDDSKKNRTAKLEEGKYPEKSQVFVNIKEGTEPIAGTVLAVNIDKETEEVSYKIRLNNEEGSVVNHITANKVWGRTHSMMDQKMMILKMIARYAINTKFILLSATPMYATAIEILDILDILLLNDGREVTKKSEIFKNDYSLKGEAGGEATRELAKLELIRASRGYISYIRGENPLIFPIRLDPTQSILNDDHLSSPVNDMYQPLTKLGYKPRPVFSFTQQMSDELERGIVKSTEWIQDPCLYRDIMSSYQLACWVGICDQGFGSGVGKRKTTLQQGGSKGTKWVFSGLLQGKAPTHASIVTFPLLSDRETISILNGNEIDDATIAKLKDCYGKKGFDTTFQEQHIKGRDKKLGITKYTIAPNLDQDFLKLLDPISVGSDATSNQLTTPCRGIQKYSTKISNILRLINSCHGVVFIYSEYVVDGVNMVGMALEANGYHRYYPGQTWDRSNKKWDGENHNMLADGHVADGESRRNYQGKLFSSLEDSDTSKIQGRYVMLKGEDMSQGLIDTLIVDANSYDNTNGSRIKVIIGSKKVREGFSLKAVRQIHILDPWYHLNAIDQSSGRGIRNYSHSTLGVEDRNVTVFLHTASIPTLTHNNLTDFHNVFIEILPDLEETREIIDDTSEKVVEDMGAEMSQKEIEYPITILETSDEYLYRKAYEHTKAICKVERYLQRYAVDCKLNVNGNMFPTSFFDSKGVNPYQIVTSQNKKLSNFKIGNRDNSWQCGFSSCVYTCLPEDVSPSKTVTPYDYYIELLPITSTTLEAAKKIFKNIFLDTPAITLKEIIEKMSSEKIKNKKLLYLAIDQVVKDREPVYDSNYREGYVIFRHKKGETKPYYMYQPLWMPTNKVPDNISLENLQDENIAPLLRQLPPPNTLYKTLVEDDIQDEVVEKDPETLDQVADTIISQLEAYVSIILSIISNKLSSYYPISSDRKFGSKVVYPKGKSNPVQCENQCVIPTYHDLALMGGFSILDPLGFEEEYNILIHVCKWSALRLTSDLTRSDQELWYNYKPLSIKHNVNYHELLDNSPSLKAMAYYFYLGDLPENIVGEYSDQIDLKIGTKVHVQATMNSSKFDGIIVSEVDEDQQVKVEDLSTKFKKTVQIKNITPLVNRYRQIHCEKIKISVIHQGKTETQERILPTLFRITKINKENIVSQPFYRVEYHSINLDTETVLVKRVSEEHQSEIDKYKLTTQDIDPDRIPKSRFFGYSNTQSETGRCNNVAVEKFSSFTYNEVFNYILAPFYYKNKLKKTEGIKGCCALQAGKKIKTEIINSILTSVNGDPYKKLFSRYAASKPLIPIETVMDNIDKELQKVTICLRKVAYGKTPPVVYNEKDGMISDSAISPLVTLELMLLLRFFRFIAKGNCQDKTSLLPVWYLRKTEALIYLN